MIFLLLILFPGGDDKRVLIWKMASAMNCSATPTALKGSHELNIFSLVFSCDNAFVYSSGKKGRVKEKEGWRERERERERKRKRERERERGREKEGERKKEREIEREGVESRKCWRLDG